MEKLFFRSKFYWLFFLSSLFYAQSPPSCTGSWGPPIVNQTFGQGDAFSKWYGPLSVYAPGAATSTIFVGAAGPPGGFLQDGYSGLVKSPNVGGFISSSDHTGNPNGLMLLVNAPSTAATVFFEDIMNNLCPNTTLKLSIWILNVNAPGTCSPHYQFPNLTLRAIDVVTGNILGSSATGNIPIDSKWKEFHIIFNNASSSSVKLQVVNNSVGNGCGNDLAIDDITVSPCIPSVITPVPDSNSILCPNQNSTVNFTATLTGNSYSPAEYQWQYSADSGTTWVNEGGPTTNPNHIFNSSGLPSGEYWIRFKVGPQGSSLNSQCNATSSTSIVTIGIPPITHDTSLSSCSDTNKAVFNLKDAEGSISSTPGVYFSYYDNLADATAGNANTINNPTAYSSGSTIIYVRVFSGSCYSIAELHLVVNVKPEPVISASSSVICHDIPVTLTSSLSTGNIWSTGETTQSITVSTAGIYTLVNDNGFCKSDSVAITIVKDTDPHLQISGNLMFCEGDSTTLTAQADDVGNTFLWSNGTAGNSLTVTTPGTYTVTVTTVLGCQYQESVTVTMDTLIIVNIAPPPNVITCKEHSTTLDATSSVYQSGATFLWTTSNGGVILSGANTLQPTVTKGGVYTLTITSATPTGCIKQSSVTVVEDTVPPPVLLSATQMAICKGDSVVLTASGAISYTWTGLPGNGNTQTVSPAATTTYTVEGTGSNGCTAEASITITVVPAIESSLHDIKICQGQKGMLDAGSGSHYTYLWNTGETTKTIEVTHDGTYTVTISNGVCSKQYSAHVAYIQIPDILEVMYENNYLKIMVGNNENIPLEFSIDDGLVWQSSDTFYNVLKNTQYPIRVRNVNTFCDASELYYTFFLPNVITPNGDGHNDVISFAGIAKYRNFSAVIVDRYGQQVFKATEKNAVWDGKYLDRPLPSSSYWYNVSWEDKVSGRHTQRTGWILLKNRDN